MKKYRTQIENLLNHESNEHEYKKRPEDTNHQDEENQKNWAQLTAHVNSETLALQEKENCRN